MTATIKISLILLLLSILGVRGQRHTLKAVGAGKNPNTTPWQIFSTVPAPPPVIMDRKRNTGQTFKSAASVCAYGMWALYNETNFGETLESSTSVATVRGYEIGGTCASSSVYPIFRNIQSANFLGHTDPAMRGLDIYSEPNFLGSFAKLNYPNQPNVPMTIGADPGPKAIKLGSIAITGVDGFWRLCPDQDCQTGNAVCINMKKIHGGMYMNRNVQNDKSIPWPVYIRAIEQTNSETCEGDFSPAAEVATLRSDVEKELEIFVGDE